MTVVMVVDAAGSVGENPALVLDNKGNVHVSYYGDGALWYTVFPQGGPVPSP